MTTFLSILLAIFLVLFAAVFIGLLWLRAKARKAGAHFLVASLKAALVGLRDKAAKPENANDKELADLIARLDTAHAQAREALNKEDYTGALKIVAPFLEDWPPIARPRSASAPTAPTPSMWMCRPISLLLSPCSCRPRAMRLLPRAMLLSATPMLRAIRPVFPRLPLTAPPAHPPPLMVLPTRSKT